MIPKPIFLCRLCFVLVTLLAAVGGRAQQWSTNGPFGGPVTALAVSGTNLFAGTPSNGVFLSTNNGATWTAVNSGLTMRSVWTLAVSGTNLFAGTLGGGVFLSTNNGASWTAVNSGLTHPMVMAFAVIGTNLFAGTWGGVFLSTNNGATWTAINSGLTDLSIRALAVSGTNLFAGTRIGGVFLSTNNGATWTAVNFELTNLQVRALAVSGAGLFAGTDGGGVFLSTNNGTSWTEVNSGLNNQIIRALAVSGSNLFAGTGGGVFLSTNDGGSWTEVNSGLTNQDVNSLILNGTNAFVGTNNGVFLSTNSGASWTAVNSGLTNLPVPALAVSGSNLYAGAHGGGVFLSANNGASWSDVNSGLTDLNVVTLAVSGTNLFAGTWRGVFLSTNNGATWAEVNSGLTNQQIQSLVLSGTNLFAGTWGGGVFVSTNNGASWSAANSGLTNLVVNTLAVSGTNLYAGTNGGGMFLSTNIGASWTAIDSGLPNLNIASLAVSGANLFAGTDGGGVFLSINNGASWSAVNSGLTSLSVRALAASGTHLFAGTFDGGVFLSTNNGASWSAINSGLTNQSVRSLAASGTNLFAGTMGGVFIRGLPAITGFTPASGASGTVVTISGANFSTTPTANAVMFNGVAATVTGSTATGLTVTVPANATTGPIAVTVGGVTATSGANFTVTDSSPPVITDLTPSTADFSANRSFTFTAQLTDGESAITGAEVAWRPVNSAGALASVPLVRAGSNHTATLSFASVLPELGIEYRITAQSAGGTASTGLKTVPVQSPEGLAIPYANFGSSVSHYRIVSVPLALTNASVGQVFDELGAYNRETWRMFRHQNGVTEEVTPQTVLAPGLGYWLIARNNPGRPLLTGPGVTVAASSAAPFEIDLQAGWNQIGNPYTFNLSWADVQAANPGLPGLRVFDRDFTDATRLDRMSGGFVRVNANQKLRFPVLWNSAMNSGRPADDFFPGNNGLSQGSWQVKFNIDNGERNNLISGFGMAPDAKAGFDPLDGLNMPPFFASYLEVQHTKKDGPDFFSLDMVPTQNSHVWQFDVVTNQQQRAINLSWGELDFEEAGQQLFLWDESARLAINMFETTRYVFWPEQSRSFRVIYGPEDFVRKETSVNELVLHTVWPNPASDVAHLRFTLPAGSAGQHEVQVDLIDNIGQIRQTVRSRHTDGPHEILLKNLESYARGLYVVRLKLGHVEKSTRLVLR